MRTLYSLRVDPNLRSMQEASTSTGPVGLRQTHGLVASAEWWINIERGKLELQTVVGKVARFWPGHHGDWPEFELVDPSGAHTKWGCMVASAEAEQAFRPGCSVEVDFVRQELKGALNGSHETKLVVAIRVAA
jgi:hypothetical protein